MVYNRHNFGWFVITKKILKWEWTTFKLKYICKNSFLAILIFISLHTPISSFNFSLWRLFKGCYKFMLLIKGVLVNFFSCVSYVCLHALIKNIPLSFQWTYLIRFAWLNWVVFEHDCVLSTKQNSSSSVIGENTRDSIIIKKWFRFSSRKSNQIHESLIICSGFAQGVIKLFIENV